MRANTTSKIDLQISSLEVVLAKTAQRQQNETIGQRLARLRRDRGITQAELAEKLEMTQPMISGYEHGTLRLHGELIVELARILSVSSDELLGLGGESKSMTAPKNRRLLRRLQELDSLPRRDQQALLRTIDAFLRKAG
jgi:transcriptional regulator with XRE-family HTH domain